VLIVKPLEFLATFFARSLTASDLPIRAKGLSTGVTIYLAHTRQFAEGYQPLPAAARSHERLVK
jgi:hypothetical protein